jgi:predicted MFS family arabinose efflux permease
LNSAHRLNRRAAILAFLAFAVTYFLSALIRAITATLSPNLTQEFGLSSGDLGLLAGAYFFGFAITQLPLGSWLDRLGPKKVILRFVAVAVLACLAFSWAEGFGALLAARFLCGVGLSACLMAPLTGYRRWFDPASQLRANSWMLMTGSLGMMASTLPVQWLLPVLGWRPLFWGLAAALLIAMLLMAAWVPVWQTPAASQSQPDSLPPSYAMVWRDPYFRSLLPLAFFSYGGLLAVQNLWAVPWMTEVAGYSALQAAAALFWINVAMLCTFWAWGMANPWLTRHGLRAERLVELGLPASFLVLAVLIGFGNTLSDWTGACWALYCVCCTVVSLTQPAVGMAFAPALAGRALSAFNLVIFSGVFLVQWGIGLGVDRLSALGLSKPEAFRATMALFLLCCVGAYIYFVLAKRDNLAQVNS